MARDDGSIHFKTDLDNSDLEKQLKDAEKSVDDLKRKIESKTSSKSALAQQMEEVADETEVTKRTIEKLQSRLNELRNSDGPMNGPKIQVVSNELSKQITLYERLIAQAAKLDNKWDAAERELIEYDDKLAMAESRYSRLSSEAQAAASKSSSVWHRVGESIRSRFASVADGIRSRMSDAANKSVAPWQDFKRRVSSLLKQAFVFGVIVSGLNAIRNAIGSMLMKNNQFNASVQNLKAVLNGFLGQMVSAVLPVLTGVVNTLAAALKRVASFIDRFFGTNIMGQIASARNESVASTNQSNASKQAEYAAQVAAAEERQAKAAQKLAKEQKKANQQLFSFDELNKLAEESSEDATDAMDDYTDSIASPDLETPWTSFLNPDAGLFQGVLDWLDEIRRRIETDLTGPFARIREGLNLIKQGWDEVVQGIQNGDWALVWRGVGDMVIGALYVIEGAFGAFMDWLDELTGFRFHNIFEGMKLAVHGFVEVVEGLLRGDLALVFQGVCDMLDGVVQTFHGVIDAVGGILKGGVSAIFDYLSEKIPGLAPIFQGAKELICGVIDEVVEFLHETLGGVREFIGGFLDVVVGLVTLDADRVIKGVSSMIDGIKRNLNAFIQLVRNIVGNIFDWLIGVANSLFTALANKFPQLANLFGHMRDTVVSILTFLKGTVLGLIDGIMSAVTGLMDGLKSIVRGAIDVIVGIFTGSGERVVNGLRGIVNGFINILEGLLDGVLVGVVGFANGIIDGLSKLPGVSIDPITFYGVNLPRLASGAVIPPNREFMAVLGDQRSGNNIEAPEALMRQVVREETGPLLADVVAALMNGGGSGQSQDVVLVVGRKELARETLRGMRELSDSRELGMSGIVFG